ncbi:MAG: 50S ribosomal protein L30 [Chloroherpetonaceae bacterium]|nr:50S ribosomal protein L30 [Chloroherpetonaceae bacterium]MCS7212222.1 50S ribosomal protein L30 [Chloroherpetonaceae bacterium]MDW8018973.1 50S ribosomal protein L30 [Chloroherpetonaceae bacterium]MDW8464894.1 50S ribosomal protein L30 [Chloroherpetonaceae bacterium]
MSESAAQPKKKLKITQVRSIIGSTKKQKATIRALKLGRPNYSVVLNDDPRLRGQLEVVAHLVKVEELN